MTASLQALKIAATRGSQTLESLEQLTKLVDGNLALPGELLPIFYHHLDPKKIPHPERPAPNMMHSMKLAIAALKGITSCLNQHDAPQNKVLLPDIESHWAPMIWKWIHFFLDHCFAESMLPTVRGFKVHVYFATVNLLSALVHQPELRTTVASTPGVIALTTKLWIMETKNGYKMLVFNASRVLERFVSEPKPGWTDQIVASASGPSVVAKTILDRIRINLIEPSDVPTNYSSIHCDLLITIGFTVGPTADVCRALWSQQSIAIITEAMFCLASNRIADIWRVTDSDISQCLTFCASYLHISFTTSEDTYTSGWIVEAVEARLIPALLKATHFFGHHGELEPICSNLLGRVIPQYLIYRSVLRSVERSLKNIRRHGHEKKLTEAGSFRDSWNTLNDVAIERLAIKGHIDGNPPPTACHNSKCLRMCELDEFMCCSGCLLAYYCCKSCQQYAWKHGDHRTNCKTIQARRSAGIPQQVSIRDMDFVTFVTIHYQRKFQDQIGDMRLRQLILHPTVNPLSLCTLFDYTKVPVAITVGPLDDFFPEDSRNHPDYDAATKQLIECNGLLSLMCARTPSKVIWIPSFESLTANPRSSDGFDLDMVREIDLFTAFREEVGLTAEEISKINSAYLGIVTTQKRRDGKI